MYCKIYVIANGAILKKKNVCKILVELYSAILVRFSIFSIQVELIVLDTSCRTWPDTVRYWNTLQVYL